MKSAPGFASGPFSACHDTAENVPVSIRINPAKKQALEGRLDILEKVPWSSLGYYLPERPVFTLDPLFHAGAYYVQEASSMFLEQAFSQHAGFSRPLRVLDLCAAPGGKSTLIQSLLPEGSVMVSNEVIQSRVPVLEENMIKWGGCNGIITNNDPRDFSALQAFFDVVLVDAPCSGSGLFRKDEHAIKEWSLQNVEHCSQRQKRILQDVLPAINEGGLLIYSTCSYSVEENEEMIKWLSEKHGMEPLSVLIDSSWNIVESSAFGHPPCYRFYPDRLKGEGFFLAVCQKIKSESQGRMAWRDSDYSRPGKRELAILKDLQMDTIHLYQQEASGFIEFLDDSIVSNLPILKKHLKIRRAGLRVGEVLKGQFLPDPELAFSYSFQHGLPSIEVSESAALDFLRKKSFLPEPGLKGWYLVRYEGLGLGWVKMLDGRGNNYYPKNWRIMNL